MILDLLKFSHVLIALSIFALSAYCFALVSTTQNLPARLTQCYKLNNIILILVMLAMLLGTLMVHPKHYSFDTPWIKAAYILVMIFSATLIALIVLLKKQILSQRRFWQVAYFTLTLILAAIIRDAVTKTSFFLS